MFFYTYFRGLDRIDMRSLPLDNSYTYDFDGSGVSVFVIDRYVRARGFLFLSLI